MKSEYRRLLKAWQAANSGDNLVVGQKMELKTGQMSFSKQPKGIPIQNPEG